MMVKKLFHPYAVIQLVGKLPQAVIFPSVLEHDDRLLETSENIEILHSLIPVDRPVFVVV